MCRKREEEKEKEKEKENRRERERERVSEWNKEMKFQEANCDAIVKVVFKICI